MDTLARVLQSDGSAETPTGESKAEVVQHLSTGSDPSQIAE